MADISSYNPPSRPFLQPPSPSAVPSAEEVGLTGADAWAYGVSSRLMCDPGRWDLFNQVQAGMVWLDEYIREIESRFKGDDNEEEVLWNPPSDFVELVKTPGRNRAPPHSRFQSVVNAEKLAKINALHFGEVDPPLKPVNTEKAQLKVEQTVVIAESNSLEKQEPRPKTPVLSSSNNNTIRPGTAAGTDEMHVISHPSATPVPLTIAETHSTTTETAQPSHPTVHSNPSTASVSSTSGTSGVSAVGGTERRFGPRPLPAVPQGSIRSRAPSNVSMMGATTQPQQMLPRPPSRTENVAVPQPKPTDSADHRPTQTAQIHPISAPAAAPSSTLPKHTLPAILRTPSPPAKAEPDDIDMEVEVEVPLNDATITLPKTATAPIFPTAGSLSLSRKPSFAPLPNPSPVRKSMRGPTAGTSDSTGHGNASRSSAMLSTTPHSRSSSAVSSINNSHNVRTSVAAGGQRSSGWFKSISTPASAKAGTSTGTTEKKILKALDTDEKTALNTAANAAIGVVSTATIKASGNGRGEGAIGLKRKSEAMDVVESTSTGAVDSAGEERASKAIKKTGKSFAMERDTKDVEEDMDADDAHGVEGAEDGDNTAERLLKLRGILKGAGMGPEPEKSRPLVDPRSQARSEFRPVSRTGTVTSGVGEKSAKKPMVVAAIGPMRASPMKVSELVGAWEGKAAAASEASPTGRKHVMEKNDHEFGIPKSLAPVVVSTTPPGSPLAKAVEAKPHLEQVTRPDGPAEPSKSSSVINGGKNLEKALSVVPPIFKAPVNSTATLKTSIFSAPVPKLTSHATQNPSTQAKSIFTRPPPQQYGASQQSQSTTDEDTDPLFEPRKKGKTSTSTFDTASQPSQEPLSLKADVQERHGDWYMEEEGLTAGWLSRGNDTLGENEARMRRQNDPGAFDEGGEDNREDDYDEKEDSDQAFIEEDDMTNEHGTEADGAPEQEPEEIAVDSQEEEAGQEFEPDQEEEEMEEEEAIPEARAPPVTSVGGGLLAQVGSLASRAAFGLKSLRMAAAAAEREKTEKEKKEARLKEMEARRQAALQKKVEEESKKKEEVERKRKLEEERRKKEKADTTLNRSVKLPKAQVPPPEKKQPEIKRVPSKLGLGGSTLGASKIGQPPSSSKRAPTPTKAPTIKLVGQSNLLSATAALHSAPSSALTSILGPSVNKAGAKVTFKATSIAMKSNIIGTGNGSTTSLLGGKAAQVETVEAEASTVLDTNTRDSEGGIDESADLPDIRSEYSNSEDEDRPRTYNPPGWAQSPDLRQALEGMRTVNPDTIFGAMPQLRMEEIFPGRRKSKFRARTSSANWAGTDGVTAEEEEEYARRMGFER